MSGRVNHPGQFSARTTSLFWSVFNERQHTWVERDLGPEFAEWRALAVAWLETQHFGLADRLNGLIRFLDKYLYCLSLARSPKAYLDRDNNWPDFYETTLPQSQGGIKWNNKIHAFLKWVLLTHFSEPDDNGRPIVVSGYRNPVKYLSQSGISKPAESVRSPLPYRYIKDLREILASGQTFREWEWAHTASQGRIGSNDWYPVDEDQIDYEDPDCVWRRRSLKDKGDVLEMWSPVRAVALLTKLMLPLRTYQVRMLDSGEADTWRYTVKGWEKNENGIVEGSLKKPLQFGVFRRTSDLETGEVLTSLYINTNKTADIGKYAEERGYVIPWQYEEMLYWLEKLRNWQEKYNPITRRISWRELDHRHLRVPKTEYQLSRLPELCSNRTKPQTA